MGLANNDRLKSESAEAMTQAEAEFNATGTTGAGVQGFPLPDSPQLTSERRVVGKAEFLEKGANPRFVVTSLSPERLGARALYEDFYCARGDMENRIKEQQLDLFADRTSAATMRANQLRLYLSSAAYMLMHALRRLGLKQTPLARAQCQTIRLKLLKIGAQVRLTVRHRLDLHVGSLSLQRGLRCRRSKPPGPFLCAAEVCPDQTPPKTKSFHRSGRALPECIPSRSSRTRKTLHSRPSTPPHHSTWTGSIAKLSENRSGLPKLPSFPNR